MSDLKEKCVYTCLIGSYEHLNEQEVAQTSSVDFICFTDDPSLTSQTWKIRQIVPTFEADPIRSQRMIKLLADEYVGEYQESLYIDNSIILKETPELIFDKYLPNHIDYALPVHSFRDTVLDEFLEVARLGFDDQNRIMEQLNHYALYAGEALVETPYWTAIMLRRHHKPWVKSLGREWLAHILRYSRRDQLSINYAFIKLRHSPSQILIDNFSSEFHEWPVTKNRERNKGFRDISTSLMNSVAHTRQLEVKNQELSAQLENLTQLQTQNQELHENLTQSTTLNQELLISHLHKLHLAL